MWKTLRKSTIISSFSKKSTYKNVIIINELISQIADLVNDQEEVVLQIGEKIGEVKDLADEGKGHLAQAVVYSKTGLKRKCCMLLLIIGGALVLMAPILLSILNAKGIL